MIPFRPAYSSEQNGAASFAGGDSFLRKRRLLLSSIAASADQGRQFKFEFMLIMFSKRFSATSIHGCVQYFGDQFRHRATECDSFFQIQLKLLPSYCYDPTAACFDNPSVFVFKYGDSGSISIQSRLWQMLREHPGQPRVPPDSFPSIHHPDVLLAAICISVLAVGLNLGNQGAGLLYPYSASAVYCTPLQRFPLRSPLPG